MHLRQMGIFERGSSYDTYLEDKEKYGPCLEINLLIGDEKRLRDGAPYNDNVLVPKVKAYFKAPIATDAGEINPYERYYSRISGLHSTADIHFSIPISNIITIMNACRPEGDQRPPHIMPPLTNVVRAYRDMQYPRIQMLAADSQV